MVIVQENDRLNNIKIEFLYEDSITKCTESNWTIGVQGHKESNRGS
jgi:hypothetical protein